MGHVSIDFIGAAGSQWRRSALPLHIGGDQVSLGDDVHEVGGPSDDGDWHRRSEFVLF